MFTISDNLAHLLQLAILSALLAVVLVFVPSIQPLVAISAFMPLISVLIGFKANQSAVNATNAANNVFSPTDKAA